MMPDSNRQLGARVAAFDVSLEQEEDGRWSAWIEALPGCAAWGYSAEEALAALEEGAQAFVEVMEEKGL